MEKENSAAARLISHLARFRDEAWNEAVLNRTRLCLLDSVACFAAGRALPHFRQSAQGLGAMLGGEAPPQPTPFALAYLYGQAANALDFDDTLRGHPGAPIIGALLAIGASKGLPADRVLRGMSAGYEAHWLLTAAAAPSRERASLVRSVGVWDAVAAALGAAVALGLPDEVIERVLGVAVAHSVIPYTGKWYERPVPAVKNNMGWIAAGAVMSIGLAEAGQTGVTRPLEGDAGMWRMAGSDRWALNEALSASPAVLRVGFKRYPSCWHTQEYLKTFAGLLERLEPGDGVASVLLEAPADMEKFCRRELVGPADVAFSLPALFGKLADGIEPGPLWESVDGSNKEISFEYRGAETAWVHLQTRRGRAISAAVALHDLSDLASSGLSDGEVVAKFDRLVDAPMHAAVLGFLGDEADAGTFYRVMGQSIMDSTDRSQKANHGRLGEGLPEEAGDANQIVDGVGCRQSRHESCQSVWSGT